jgi:5'-methylthioadenosine phosphorylase
MAQASKEVLQTANLGPVKIGIIGGSGLDDPDIMEERSEEVVSTPFGAPSDALISGKIGGVPCVLLARHGRKHTIMPTNVNFRANLYALKAAGCTHVVVSTACGSLKEEVPPGMLVLIDQFIDRTTKRPSTFYDGSPEALPGVCHISAAEPFCPHTRAVLAEAMTAAEVDFAPVGTMVAIEGPRFSSKAESHMFRQWGATVINMTTCPEAALAKEAGLLYAAIAMSTDYDCWREGGEPVTVEAVMKTMGENSEKVKKVLRTAIPMIAAKEWKAELEAAQAGANSSVMLW